MNKKKILIYDDEQGRTEDFKLKLEKGLNDAGQLERFNVKSLGHDKFQDAIKALELRRIKFRQKEIDLENISKDDAKNIDDASIFVIDYDLLRTEKEEKKEEENEKEEEEEFFTRSLTGEIVAYLVRCFSKCKLIIGLNQYGNNPFDLTLRGDLDSFADLNLGEDQLDNSNLWTGEWEDSEQKFRPWSWPNLCDLLCDFDKRVKDVQGNLNTSISEFLGFDRELFELLPREIVQFIWKDKEKEHFQTTFREFITESGNGLKSKDARELKCCTNDHVLARVGAARISKWLEQLVLPEQDILVDAPHLISRYPSLIAGDKEKKEKIETWNKTARLAGHEDLGLDTNLIECYRFGRDDKAHWISRPVWFWDKLRECENIKEVTEPWVTVLPNWVFCENASRFYNYEDCREFLADTVSPFTQRFIKYFDEDEVDYRPRARFSL